MVANGIITAGRQHCLSVLRSEVNCHRQTERETQRQLQMLAMCAEQIQFQLSIYQIPESIPITFMANISMEVIEVPIKINNCNKEVSSFNLHIINLFTIQIK